MICPRVRACPLVEDEISSLEEALSRKNERVSRVAREGPQVLGIISNDGECLVGTRNGSSPI
jgi:hypothetical protein